MAADLRAEESRNSTDGHIVNVTSSDERRLTTDDGRNLGEISPIKPEDFQ